MRGRLARTRSDLDPRVPEGRHRLIILASILAYLALPSIAWSLIYRSPKLVLDPVILIPVELFLPRLARPLFRLCWVVACGAMLMLEWNIFVESYWFYARLLAEIAFTGHGLAICAAIFAFLLFMALPLPRARRRLTLLACGFALYGAVAGMKMLPWGKENLAWFRVPLLRAVQVWISDGPRAFTSVVGAGDAPLTHHLYDDLGTLPAGRMPPKILVVLLESWGERPDDLAALGTAIAAIPGVSQVDRGYNHFRGSTLPAEIRELCGQLLDFSRPEALRKNCLPARLSAAGYRTTAFHGYDGFFYSRDIIYPGLGFQSSSFRSDLMQLPQCGGAFNGACDDAVVDKAIEALKAPGRQFVYVMSLTAHAPVAHASLARPYASAGALPIPGDDTQKLNRALSLYAVRAALAADRSSGTIVYLAGDHNPPGGEQENRLPPGQAPYLLVRLNSAPAR